MDELKVEIVCSCFPISNLSKRAFLMRPTDQNIMHKHGLWRPKRWPTFDVSWHGAASSPHWFVASDELKAMYFCFPIFNGILFRNKLQFLVHHLFHFRSPKLTDELEAKIVGLCFYASISVNRHSWCGQLAKVWCIRGVCCGRRDSLPFDVSWHGTSSSARWFMPSRVGVTTTPTVCWLAPMASHRIVVHISMGTK